MSWKSIPHIKFTEKVNLKSQQRPVRLTPSETSDKQAFCMQRNEKDCVRAENIKMHFQFPSETIESSSWLCEDFQLSFTHRMVFAEASNSTRDST